MYQSILYYDTSYDNDPRKHVDLQFQSDMLKDLNLDQLVRSIAIGNYKDFVSSVLQNPLTSESDIYYRQELFKDLENESLFHEIKSLTRTLDHIDSQLVSLERLVYREQKESIFLHVMNEYCDAIASFCEVLRNSSIQSKGLQMVLCCFVEYVESSHFIEMKTLNQKLVDEIGSVRYSISFAGYTIKISKASESEDYTKALSQLFQGFLIEGKRKGHCTRFQNDNNLNSVEYSILKTVQKMYPVIFQQISDFMTKYLSYRNNMVESFRKEIQFYISYLEYLKQIKDIGMPCCYPKIVDHVEKTRIVQGYDLVLGVKLAWEKKTAVMNDFECFEDERVFVVTGPNQGGKTTFTRMLGQIHYLASLGVPVSAQVADVILCKRVFTHFEHEEVAYNDNGKLQDDLLRMHHILQHMTDHCFVIINEMLSSTSYQDAVIIGEKIIQKLEEYDCISIYVTFVDELAKREGKTVSLVSIVEEGNEKNRTFKIRRQCSDGLVYAKTLVNKYKLSYCTIKERINSKCK